MKICVLIILVILISCKSKKMESDAANPIIEKVTATDAIFAEENKENVVIQTQIPQCISERIEEIKNGEKRNPPTIVTEYSVNEKKYYVIPPGCCDQYDYIIDENCKIVCSQGVGIDGKYKRTCGNILNYATTRVIWRDLR